ncbi:hypothetical protein DU508_00035 [Pedobacter chinensis]|uniref:Uncharacterized protein n=1 Tax=Pedobacter chinensis TaxID=2282421 RepID=A0A369Q1Q5_9SPHI|nr:hypothetical protein [Pedobacter chinensis]RDC58432.1 hypothetical protein DU508_00035 [Pedobacter chinensis]
MATGIKWVGGKHLSEYKGSTWKPENDFADFKPDTQSGAATFNREIKSGKLPANTERLPYSTTTGKLK